MFSKCTILRKEFFFPPQQFSLCGVCQLRFLWLRKEVENFVRGQISVFPVLCSK